MGLEDELLEAKHETERVRLLNRTQKETREILQTMLRVEDFAQEPQDV